METTRHFATIKEKVFASISFFTLVFLSLFFSSFSSVLADETIVVNGRVGDVIAGPTSNNDDDDDSDDNSSASASRATVFIEPAEERGAVFDVVNGSTQFTTPRPAFRGTTNIQNAHITLIFSFGEFRLRAFLTAAPDGTFTWISPEDFPNGNFTVTALAVHSASASIKAEASTRFSVLAPGTIFLYSS